MPREPGRPLRSLWPLAADATFLNHGSFGACPNEVIAEHERIRAAMESQPDLFFRQGVMPDAGETPLRAAAEVLRRFVNGGDGELAFVENATSGVQAVLRSIAFGRGDRILTTHHTYNAVRLMVEARCAETGAEPLVVRLPQPADAEGIVERIEAALTHSVRLAIVDHITSPTALVLPLERIVPALRRHGALVLVDGAHAVGQLPLDLAALDADWYVSNAHKWLYAPRGTAFLHASRRVVAMTRPNVVSHFVEMGFPRSFDWVGTRDYSAWLAVPAAIGFHGGFDPAAMGAHHARILAAWSGRMEALGARAAGPLSMCAAMRSFVLPQSRPAEPGDHPALVRELWERHRIQAMATRFGESLVVRASSQAYVGEEDVHRLADALDRDGWPGRAGRAHGGQGRAPNW